MRILHKNLSLLIVLLIGCPLSIFAQNKTITGTVRDALDVVIGASVTVKGDNSTGTITDMDGNFKLSVPASAKELVVSFIGYENQTVVIGNKTHFDITLKESSVMLEEVVAIGYAKVKRKDLTAATSSVGGKDLAKVPVTTAAQALSGKAAGVNVVQQSGAPGADIQITVRGGTSITQGSEPLYIVDGFQMDNGLQNVDINDIESIDVMKDASATAIYGSAGANGVILITTKSGKAGKTEVNYNSFVSFSKLGKKLDLLSVEDYVKYQYEFQLLRGNEDNWAGIFGGDVNSSDFYTGVYDRIADGYGNRAGIDWQDEVFGKTGIMQNHNVNINGGSEKTKYMLSYNYTGEDGIMAKHGYEKNSIRAKINHELWKGVRFDFSTSLQMTKVDGGGSLGGTLKQTILQPVTGGERWTNDQLLGMDLGSLFDEMPGSNNYDTNNPILNNNAITNEKYTRMATVNAGLEIDIIKNLTFRTAGNYQWKQIRHDYWDDGSTKTAASNQSPNGYGYRNNDEAFQWQITNTLNYAFDVKENHHFNVLLGQETTYWESMNLDNEYRKFSDGNFGLNDVSMGTPNTWQSGKSKVGLVSFFGRLSYNFKDRYLLNATLRADGSSKFAKGNQWDYFPSASAAWRISEEGFMEEVKDVFQNLKLRVGYGVAGNNKIDNNMYATSYGSGHYGYNGNDYITYVPGTTLGNKDLKWEKTKTVNVGLDVSVLNSRVNLSVDWYNNESANLLIKNKIPTSTGYSNQFQNIGSIRNRGVEIVLNSTNIRTKDFTWSMDFNIAFNKSKVLEIYGDAETDHFIQDYESRMGFKIQKGKSLGQFYGLIYDGIYTTDDFTQNADGGYTLNPGVPYLKGSNRDNVKPGDVKYKPTAGETDDNGNPVWSVNDRTVIGNAAPKFTGGWNNTFTYKGFDLTIFMNFVVGNDVFNMSTQRFIGPYLANQNTIAKMANRFMLIDPQTGKESTDLNRLAAMNPGQYSKDIMWNISGNNKTAISDHSSYYLEDGSYLRLNTITLGYTLPKAWVNRAKISNARIYCTLNNIHTFTGYEGYDPEVSASSSALTPGIDNSSYPRAKSWVIGLNLTF
ncbi:SusC/RagA family TonB-linked outer membrane protein [Bacteroides fluxus]|uniref:TonB-dependent receptor plug domain protein n=1 Tax=Bacteroides fluxus YIT 12057 TaxID=763034 RepID=F3PX86_9BACE|nr:TonB-dependent receptor [Bacteroides fluxus]EGF52165.1 TonB-dependent receptor plug domain protein [Bacteroides fluxus YIT 12057]